MTFLTPSWRSLNLYKRSLNHPQKVTKKWQVWMIIPFMNSWCFFLKSFAIIPFISFIFVNSVFLKNNYGEICRIQNSLNQHHPLGTMVCLVTVWHWQPPTPDASNHLPVVRGALPSWKMSGRLSPQLHGVWQFGCNLGHRFGNVIYQRPAAIPKLRKFESLESALDGQMVNLNVHL